MSKRDRQQANDTYNKAKAELERVSRRDRTETDDYLAANDAVAEAAKNVSWLRR
ncbi:hypothetical protein [Saccharopolyspora endophytica]|uniref:Uncharacterized protein n=1 Tax=Saccharopolyspora endophytica TaxID=543886 RepID=A0ABS5DE90_9PSEU|nr:hypothetical protein [Saccharopolyspora endophytica]MBQ0924610.1 hypothetical protein [Saccharopolyspora endophytica]